VTSSHSHLAIIVDFISPGRNKFEWEENKWCKVIIFFSLTLLKMEIEL
jgi:hypothetical protein